MRLFLNALLETQDFIEEYHKDIIGVDYKMYENLQDSISARVELIRFLQSNASKHLSKEKMRRLHVIYSALVKALDGYKQKLQTIILQQ